MRGSTPRYRLLALLVALALVVIACGGDDDDSVSAGDGGADDGSSSAGAGSDDPPSEPDTAIFGSAEWELTSASVDGDDLPLLDSHPITFMADGGEVGGTAACNSYFGTIAAGPTLFDGFGVTEMACDPPEAMDLEFAFLDALGRVTDASLDGDDLVMTGPDVELRFSAVAPTPDMDLEGTIWMLETLIDGDTASSVLADTSPQAVFAAAGEMTASDGCNTGSGSYEVDGDRLVLGAIRTTTRGCGDDIMRQAQMFNTVLGSDPTITIEGDQLTLTGTDGLALVFRAA